MEVIAIKKDDKVISVGVGKNCFSVENNILVKDAHVEEFKKKVGTWKEYQDAFELCQFAYENELYDKVEES